MVTVQKGIRLPEEAVKMRRGPGRSHDAKYQGRPIWLNFPGGPLLIFTHNETPDGISGTK